LFIFPLNDKISYIGGVPGVMFIPASIESSLFFFAVLPEGAMTGDPRTVAVIKSTDVKILRNHCEKLIQAKTETHTGDDLRETRGKLRVII
jgi:hypothetical protein